MRWAKSHNYITANEKINVGADATLKNEGGTYSDGGITMAAHDNLELNPSAKGFSQADFGGYVRAETLLDLTRNQTIDINGTVKSTKDLNLYAGVDLGGDSSKVHSYAQAISQVQTLISDGSADITRKGKTTSNVNVSSSAYGQAASDINIISNAGYEVYEERPFYGSTWSSDGGYKVATADAKKATLSYTPIKYIEIIKDIDNPVGKVVINNNQGSIRIKSGANVNAQDIAMTAKESISQGYTEGIVNIAYKSEEACKDEIAKLRAEIGWDKTTPQK